MKINSKILGYLIIYVTVLLKYSNCLQSFINEPMNTSVLLGEDVIIKCSIKDQRGEIIWCKDESFCTFGRKRNFTDPRFSIVGNGLDGQHDLSIKNVSFADNTKYQCQMTATDYEPAIKSNFAFLTVLVEPKMVKIISNHDNNKSLVRLTPSKMVAIECVTEFPSTQIDKKIPPLCDQLIWLLDSVQLNNTPPEILLRETMKPFNFTNPYSSRRIDITITPVRVNFWHNKELRCECKNKLSTIYGQKKFYDTKLITVAYNPIVSIVKINQEDFIEGNIIEFQCIANSSEPIINYRWHMDNITYSEGPDDRYFNLRINKDLNNKTLNCEVKTNFSASAESGVYQMKLISPPKFVNEPPSHIIARLNEDVSFSCDVASTNSPASIIWTLNGTFFYSYPKLTIYSVKRESYGTYKCIVSLRDFPKLTSTVVLLPPGPPIINANPIQRAYFGYKGYIECLFEKEPKPTTIEWYQSNKMIDPSKDVKFEIKSEIIERKGTKSILQINDVSQADFTNYTCKGVNSNGFTSKVIWLESKSVENGSILTVTIILIFLFIICSIISFFGYTKYFDVDKKKRNRRLNARRERFKPKPSAMLSTISRPYPYYPRRRNQNIMNKFKHQDLNRRKHRPVSRPVNYYSRFNARRTFGNINPSCLSQSNFNTSAESFNYLNYEQDMEMDRFPASEIYYDEAQDPEYINAKFQTDV